MSGFKWIINYGFFIFHFNCVLCLKEKQMIYFCPKSTLPESSKLQSIRMNMLIIFFTLINNITLAKQNMISTYVKRIAFCLQKFLTLNYNSKC